MFTGLVEEIGEVVAVRPVGDSIRLTVRGPLVTSDAEHGASICVSGVCLTVVEQDAGTFSADVMAQSIRMSALGSLAPGSPVNLERAMRLDTRLGGHIVQGHVDGTATLLSAVQHAEAQDEGADSAAGAAHGGWRTLRFSTARDLAPLLVDKGSVTLSGVSLTVSAISPPSEPEQWFEVSLIPETLRATTLGALEPGDLVNVETDILARHVARILRFQKGAAE